MLQIDLENIEEDYLGSIPVPPSDKQQVITVVLDNWDGIPGADISASLLGFSLCDTATESLANMDSGTSLISYNPEGGASSGIYPGTSTIYAAYPYVTVGKTVMYELPIPAFSGATKYVIAAAQYHIMSGNPKLRVTAYLDTLPVPAFQAEFTEMSGASDNYRSFGIGLGNGYPWLPGSKFVVVVGNDGNSSVTHSIFPVAAGTGDMDLGALVGGTPMVSKAQATVYYSGVPGIQFTVPEGGMTELVFDLPTLPPTWSGFPMFRYVNDAVSDIHASFLVRVQEGEVATLRSRPTRERLPR